MTDAFRAAQEWTLSDTESSLTARFDRVLEERADALAVGEASQFTYDALDRLAAGYLAACCERGWPGLGSRAALLMGHGGQQLAAALAILRGGGAVVTLNPNDPPARLSEIREAVAPAVVVTEPRFLDRARSAGFDDDAVVIEPRQGPADLLDVPFRCARLSHLHFGLNGPAKDRDAKPPQHAAQHPSLHQRA